MPTPTGLARTMLIASATAIAAGCVAPVGNRARSNRVWLGPMPFTDGRALRPDFFPTLSHGNRWPQLLAATDVFKSFIMILPNTPLPGRNAPEAADADLRALTALLERNGTRTAFEVGGLRQGQAMPQRGRWGKRVAANELVHLRRWLEAGGRIDYLTTDHAVMMNIGCFHYAPGHRDCGMNLEETLEELADYFEAMHAAMPGTRFGVIESLGFFHVNGPDGREYVRTVPKLPVWHFEHYFDLLQTALARHGIELDHFHVDFGYEGVLHDGGGPAADALDFGRILGVEQYVQSKGVHAGVIVNAFHDRSVEAPDPVKASRQAIERTQRFWRGYLQAGGAADHLVFQTWQPYPDRTGPETDPTTVLGMFRSIVPGCGRSSSDR